MMYNLGEIDGMVVTELFNGSANTIGNSYLLNDSILNYRYLVISASVSINSTTDGYYDSAYKSSIIIEPSDILKQANEYRIFTRHEGKTTFYTILFTFKDDTHLWIESNVIKNSSTVTLSNSRIYNIVGIN